MDFRSEHPWHLPAYRPLLARLGPGLRAAASAVSVVLAASAVALLAGCAATPSSVPAWQAGSSRNYELQHPGLGASQRYNLVGGWIDVYRYDMRRTWADGTSDPQFLSHFESTIDEVRGYARRGVYGDLQVGPVQEQRVAGEPFRTVGFTFTRDGRPQRSATWLTARRGQLLKLRITLAADAPVDIDTLARRFITQELAPAPGGRPGR